MNQNEKIRVLYVQPGKYPEEIKIPNTLETFQKYVCGSIESVRLDRDAYIICNDEGKLLPLPPNRLYGPTDFFAGPFLICGDGGEDLISLTDSQTTKYEKKYHSPLIFLELYPKPITLKCTKCRYGERGTAAAKPKAQIILCVLSSILAQFVKEYSPKSLRNREGFWYNRRKPPREAPSWKSTPKTPAAKQWLLT